VDATNTIRAGSISLQTRRGALPGALRAANRPCGGLAGLREVGASDEHRRFPDTPLMSVDWDIALLTVGNVLLGRDGHRLQDEDAKILRTLFVREHSRGKATSYGGSHSNIRMDEAY
jgi:hypothetical protein